MIHTVLTDHVAAFAQRPVLGRPIAVLSAYSNLVCCLLMQKLRPKVAINDNDGVICLPV